MPGAVFLEGEKIDLRTIERDDLERVRDIFNKEEVWRNLSHNTPANYEQEENWFEAEVVEGEGVNLAISYDEELTGVIGITPKKEEGLAEIGLWIDPEYHGNGYGTEASKLMIDYAFDELRYHKIFAKALEENSGSKNLWDNLGFEKEATLKEQHYRNGEFEDVCFYGVLEYEWRSE